MKYSASITLVDEDGNIVHERELNSDELIEELLTPQKAAEEEHIETPVPAAKPKPGKKKVSVSDFRAGIKKASAVGKKRGSTCGKCKQSGHNAKTCGRQEEEVSEESDVLMESEYDQVKEGQADGVSSKDLADDLGLPHEQVNFAFAAPEYSLFVHHMAARRKGNKN